MQREELEAQIQNHERPRARTNFFLRNAPSHTTHNTWCFSFLELYKYYRYISTGRFDDFDKIFASYGDAKSEIWKCGDSNSDFEKCGDAVSRQSRQSRDFCDDSSNESRRRFPHFWCCVPPVVSLATKVASFDSLAICVAKRGDDRQNVATIATITTHISSNAVYPGVHIPGRGGFTRTIACLLQANRRRACGRL